MLEDQSLWENRKEYIQILDLFISKKITLDQFFQQFFALEYSNRVSSSRSKKKLEEEILLVNSNEIDIQVNPKSCGFTKVISYLFSLADLCDPDVTLEMNLENPKSVFYGISEEYFRLKIEEYFLPELKKYCEKS